ncbi:MAG: SAM-dependent methyltransferase [Moraxellaceae bacterium]|jgi:SAM-dependent methyltransferase|nr:SAM-dependent methyltransferase [Moraxellaceae bacterium]
MTRRESDFALAVELLCDAPAPLAWANLGDWSTATHYTDACRDLAVRIGRAAALQGDDRVLDLACGHGASLALWPAAFGVRRVCGLEFQSRCVERIRAQAPAALKRIVPGRFDTLPSPFPGQAFDAVVCVDAAYHARSLADLAAFAAQHLRAEGRFAFTTLLAPEHRPPSSLLRFVLARAGIPAASVLPEPSLLSTLGATGFTDIAVQRLDAEVLQGFPAFIRRRRPALHWSRKVTAGWLKIEATAWLCQWLFATGALHYGLVSAVHSGTHDPS